MKKAMPLAGAILVTGNSAKLAEASRILGFEITADTTAAANLPEIQELDLEIVLRAKAEAAWQILGQPLIVEDTALELEALNGFPGPLVKWLLEAVGSQGIAKLGLSLGDPRARAVCALLFRDQDRTLIARGETQGVLVDPPRGDGGFGWDPVFQPASEALTYAELGPSTKDQIGHRGRAWRALLAQLAS